MHILNRQIYNFGTLQNSVHVHRQTDTHDIQLTEMGVETVVTTNEQRAAHNSRSAAVTSGWGSRETNMISAT